MIRYSKATRVHFLVGMTSLKLFHARHPTQTRSLLGRTNRYRPNLPVPLHRRKTAALLSVTATEQFHMNLLRPANRMEPMALSVVGMWKQLSLCLLSPTGGAELESPHLLFTEMTNQPRLPLLLPLARTRSTAPLLRVAKRHPCLEPLQPPPHSAPT